MYYEQHMTVPQVVFVAMYDMRVTSLHRAYLSTRFSSPKLPSFHETSIPVCPDNPVIESRAIYVTHAVLRVQPVVISVIAR